MTLVLQLEKLMFKGQHSAEGHMMDSQSAFHGTTNMVARYLQSLDIISAGEKTSPLALRASELPLECGWP